MTTAVRTHLTERLPVRRLVWAVERPDHEQPLGALGALAISLWFGLSAGLLELGLQFAQKPFIDPSPGFFRMNRHIVWSVPTVNLALFGCCGLLVALAVRVSPRLRAQSVVAPPVLLAVLTLLLSCRWLHLVACLVLASVVAFRLTRRIAANLAVFRRLVQVSMPALAVVVAGFIFFPLGAHVLWSRSPTAIRADRPAEMTRAPNVLLVVLDTVRADHLSLHGYQRDTSPNLARIARRGIVFEQARSTAPWTLPSHASMMTGRWPHELSAGINSPLDGSYQTLAEYLASNGYATAGFVANNAYAGAETGLGRGFTRYEDHILSLEDVLWCSSVGQRVILWGLHPPEPRTGGNPIDYHRKAAAQVFGDALFWTARNKDRPFFAFLNIYDAHDPYLPPAEFGRHFGVKPESAADMATLNRWFVLDKKLLTARQRDLVRDAYDDCLASIDLQLGRFWEVLDRAGVLANTLVIITADHGEHLGEHELFGHASSLYDAEIHVPLVVLLPGGAHAGRSISAPVSLRDLAATVADLTGLAGSPFPGRSLAGHWTHGGSLEPEPSFSEVDGPVNCAPNQGRSPVFSGPLQALAAGKEVYIQSGAGREELFDVETDPMQSRNLAALPQSRQSLDRFRSLVARFVQVGQGNTDPAPGALAHGPRPGSRFLTDPKALSLWSRGE
ncbi:MAG TPA: sulfatase [Isosphaeraceae bacterium]|nr:sulfatase [Isosphaeraceae bacterium]